MGARQFGPDIAHFLTPDFFYGSLSNLSLSTDPLTGNRYDMAGGNPISFNEGNGHQFTPDGDGGATTNPSAGSQSTPTTSASSPDAAQPEAGARCGGGKFPLACGRFDQPPPQLSNEDRLKACAFIPVAGAPCNVVLAVQAAQHGDVVGAALYGAGAVLDVSPFFEVGDAGEAAIDVTNVARAAKAAGRASDVADEAKPAAAPAKAAKDPVETGASKPTESAAAGRPAADSGAPRASEGEPVAGSDATAAAKAAQADLGKAEVGQNPLPGMGPQPYHSW
jgi:hypothetical protein